MNSPHRSNGVEVADVFREYASAYKEAHKLPLHQLKVISAIQRCRTAALGEHVDECDACGHQRVCYNSCRNRHCPKCQSLAREKWLRARQSELLPLPYFHLVFTIPDLLNPLALVNQRVIYDILFHAASESLLQLGQDPKHLGAHIGVIAILHILRQGSGQALGTKSDGSPASALHCPGWRVVRRWPKMDRVP